MSSEDYASKMLALRFELCCQHLAGSSGDGQSPAVFQPRHWRKSDRQTTSPSTGEENKGGRRVEAPPTLKGSGVPLASGRSLAKGGGGHALPTTSDLWDPCNPWL